MLAFYAYRLLARFAEVLPSSAIPPLARFVARLGVLASPKKAALVRSHITRVKGADATNGEVRAAFASYIRYWLEALRLPVVPKDFLAKSVTSEGVENIDAAVEKGNGLILAVPHVGNWDVAGVWLINQGIPLTVVVEKLEPEKLSKWFNDFRESIGMRVLVNDSNVGAELMKALRRNEAIALLCDRDVDGTGLDVEFFGEKTRLPKGPATLALRTGAALLPAIAYDTDKGHHICIEHPVELERNGKLREDVERGTNALTKRIEELIRREPAQWHLFQPNWPSEHT